MQIERTLRTLAPLPAHRYGRCHRPCHASRLAARFGMSEVETIQYALKQLAKEEIPAYEPDDGDLTARQIAGIRKLVPQGHIKSSLF